MKKRFLCLILALVMVFSLVPSAVAANDEATQAAQTLYELGLFRGTGINPDGTPIFDLDKTPTRNQAVIMLVRLLGKEEEALAGDWSLPFTDVAKDSTAFPYIGYAYANGLTSGTTATTYSGTNPIKANQYITFVLRALGYESGKDFQVGTSYLLSDQLGITHGEYANVSSFTRGDVAKISLGAHEVQEVLRTAPYWGLPEDIRWIANPTCPEDVENNTLYAFLFGNYSLNFPREGNWLYKDTKSVRELSHIYPDLMGAYANFDARSLIGTLVTTGKPVTYIMYHRKGVEPSLSMEEVYANQLAALEKAMEIRDSLHQNGKIKDGMSEKQIAQAYYNYLVGLNVRSGGGSEAAAKGQSVEYDTAYACLVNKKGDCVGRAAAFNLLVHLEGISAQGVAGSIIGTGSGHVLSRVVLDGEEHFCDWGSSKKGIYKDISNWFEFETESLEAARAAK